MLNQLGRLYCLLASFLCPTIMSAKTKPTGNYRSNSGDEYEAPKHRESKYFSRQRDRSCNVFHLDGFGYKVSSFRICLGPTGKS